MPVVDVPADLSPALSAGRAPQTDATTRHTHPDDELTCVLSGEVRITVGETTWDLGPTRSLWIPAGTEHLVEPRPGSLTIPLFFPPGLVGWDRPVAVHTSERLRTIQQVLLQPGLTHPSEVEHATRQLVHLLPGLAEHSLQAPLPRDPRAVAVARALLADPADDSTLEEWARRTYSSVKTLQRLFVAETGVTFPQWRTQARLARAADLLRDGGAVGTVAHRVGYSTASGFVHAFHRLTGTTPARYRYDGPAATLGRDSAGRSGEACGGARVTG